MNEISYLEKSELVKVLKCKVTGILYLTKRFSMLNTCSLEAKTGTQHAQHATQSKLL